MFMTNLPNLFLIFCFIFLINLFIYFSSLCPVTRNYRLRHVISPRDEDLLVTVLHKTGCPVWPLFFLI